ncbi:MAG: hypothetical protein HY751_04175 [Nitrospinae bacterium]|nr:hypothetical protein [Nitrospinota bacterium]
MKPGKLDLLRARTGFYFLILSVFFYASSAFAYGYGEKEDPMATIFKSAVSSARAGQWGDVVKLADEGVALQKGHLFEADKLVPKIRDSVTKKDVSATAAHLANMVYLSIREKLWRNLKDGEGNFKTSKSRLAMARQSYLDVLDGNVKKQSPERSKAILEQFDKALVAMGNPGVFGVGKKAADPVAGEQAVKTIENLIERTFPGFK